MALLSALFTFLGNKIGTLLQAILGWSVTALFGRLSSFKQSAFSGLLLASLAWPLLVAGIFEPAITSWAVAAMPLHDWLGKDILRIASVVLAVVLPALVGLAVHFLAPRRAQRGGIFRTVLGGYPLTIGFALACLVSAFTVAIVKIVTLTKRWTDEHVYAQPKPDRYDAAAREIAEAVREVDGRTTIADVPVAMRLALDVLKFFARGTIDALVERNPRRITGKDVELYLYPGDLLIRGKPKRVARVRAALLRTSLRSAAYLVAEPESQKLQDRIEAATTDAALDAVRHELHGAEIPFDEWLLLEDAVHRTAGALAHDEADGEAPSRAPRERERERERRGFGVVRSTTH